MEPTHSNDGSQGGFAGGNVPPYLPTWNPYQYGFPPGMPQPTPSGYPSGMAQPTTSGIPPGMPQPSQSWYHPGMPQLAPNVGMIHPNQHGPQVFVPAENTTSIVQIDDEGVDEPRTSAAAKAKGKKPKVVTRVKLSNFSMEEDRNLVTSWLEISNDAITCNAQKKDGMWLKILGRYELRRGSYPERSMKSLQSRWDCIKAESGKFASCYADVVRENPSGMTDADKVCALLTHYMSMHSVHIPRSFL